MANKFILPKDKHDRIFENEIKNEYLRFVKSSNNPEVILLGGQAGSGKSTVSNEYAKNNFLVIDVDAYREFHPNHKQLTKENPLTAAQLTHADASLWATDVSRYVAKNKISAVVETTFGSPETVLEKAAIFQKENYNITAVVVSVPEKTSWLSVLKRFEEAYERDPKTARFVPQAQHDKQYRKITDTINELYEKKLVSELKIVDRDQNPIFTDHFVNGAWQLNKNPVTSLLEHRAKPFNEKQIKQHQKDWQYVLSAMEKRNAPAAEIFAAKVMQTHHENEFKNPNVARNLAIDPEYKANLMKNIETNILNKPLPDQVKLKLIGKVYNMAEMKIKIETKTIGDKLLDKKKQAIQQEIQTPKIKINRTETKDKTR
ncbi:MULTISPECIES: zeta toxin family protein [Snodgrassella]|uniref:zeta toxin family protein n=1 Tax=Snodgrassella TaxID=1193515 RepID=UPI0008156BB7|nr:MULTISPECIES: zeta toxin family protein [Snodgrassella]SCC03852.1 2-phosphoglycerate kinase [Snodgrassella sp. R-53583]